LNEFKKWKEETQLAKLILVILVSDTGMTWTKPHPLPGLTILEVPETGLHYYMHTKQTKAQSNGEKIAWSRQSSNS